MATRQQIARLAERIEQLASCHAPPEGPFEHWAAEGNKAYQYSNPNRVITYAEMRAELKARPTTRRIIHRYVHALDGRPPHAACQAASVTPYTGLLKTKQLRHDERRASEACPILCVAGHRGAERHGEERSNQERSGCCS